MVDGINVINGLSGFLTIEGFSPNTIYQTEWHAFGANGVLTTLHSSSELSCFLSQLKQLADMVIVNGPAVKVTDTVALATEIIGAVMIVQPGHTLVDTAEARLE